MTTASSGFRRADERAIDEMHKVTITRSFTNNPIGSVLVTFSNTRVVCTASAEQLIPRFKRNFGEG